MLKFMENHQGSVSRLMDGFTWEKASDYVKQKRWREDLNKDTPKPQAAPAPPPQTTVEKPAAADAPPPPKPQVEPKGISMAAPAEEEPANAAATDVPWIDGCAMEWSSLVPPPPVHIPLSTQSALKP
ncbi:MAG: hypothetical protein M5U26_24810 [Planctomycetota bacterium]|nr:hypothetical protein [Planctomycetota bacterium]